MKTITELNGKSWYRALKVVYIGFAILCYGIAAAGSVFLFISIKEHKEMYREELRVDAERMAFIQEMQSNGYDTKQIADAFREKYHYGRLFTLKREEYKAIYGQEQYEKLNGNSEDEQEPLRLEFPAKMGWLLLFVPLFAGLAWLMTQLPKWIFYYIAVGKIKPPKQ